MRKLFAYWALFAVSGLGELPFTGSFTPNEIAQFFNFAVGGLSNVTFVIYSYAGGTNAAGTLIPRGVVDPILSVYKGSGFACQQRRRRRERPARTSRRGWRACQH